MRCALWPGGCPGTLWGHRAGVGGAPTAAQSHGKPGDGGGIPVGRRSWIRLSVGPTGLWTSTIPWPCASCCAFWFWPQEPGVSHFFQTSNTFFSPNPHKLFHLCGWDMKNNIIRDGSKDGFQVMILKMKNIIEKANANKTAICFYSAVCVGNAIRFAGLGYAAFFVFSSKGENRYSSFL